MISSIGAIANKINRLEVNSKDDNKQQLIRFLHRVVVISGKNAGQFIIK